MGTASNARGSSNPSPNLVIYSMSSSTPDGK
jgi:hypothetical protein